MSAQSAFSKMVDGILHRQGNIPLPTKEFLERINNVPPFTPDQVDLENMQKHLVFCCDNTMLHMPKHEIIGKPPLMEAFTTKEHSVWKVGEKEKSFPVPLPPERTNNYVPWADQRGAPPARIRGELFSLDTEKLKELDTFKENGVQFKRRRTKIEITYTAVIKVRDRAVAEFQLNQRLNKAQVHFSGLSHFVEAWFYSGVPKYWEERQDKENCFTAPVKIYKSQKIPIDKWYFFTKHDLK